MKDANNLKLYSIYKKNYQQRRCPGGFSAREDRTPANIPGCPGNGTETIGFLPDP